MALLIQVSGKLETDRKNLQLPISLPIKMRASWYGINGEDIILQFLKTQKKVWF